METVERIKRLKRTNKVIGDRGQRGRRGKRGIDGLSIKGDRGDSIKGDKGDKGDSIKGDKGDKGDSIKGDKGEPGKDLILTEEYVQRVLEKIPIPKNGKSIKGEKGEKGDKGKDLLLDAKHIKKINQLIRQTIVEDIRFVVDWDIVKVGGKFVAIVFYNNQEPKRVELPEVIQQIIQSGGGGGGGTGGVPTKDDKNLSVLSTISGDQTDTGLVITNTPLGNSYVAILINGVYYNVGDGSTISDPFYFSADGGITAKAIGSIVAADSLFFNQSVAGFKIRANDRVDQIYDV